MRKLMFNILALKLSFYFQLTSAYQIYNKINFIVNMLSVILCLHQLSCVNISGTFDLFASLPPFSICRQHCNVLPNETLTSLYFLLPSHSSTVCQV